MVRITYLFAALLFLEACADHQEIGNKDVIAIATSIIPKPNELKVDKNYTFTIKPSTIIVAEQSLDPISTVVNEYLHQITGYDLESKTDAGENTLRLALDANLNEEQYTIEVNASAIDINGGSPKAVLLGFQNLRQLLITQEEVYQIPFMSINDQPRFGWRGLQLDCARHFMEKDFVKRYIDLLALYKMNVLHWHLTEDQGWRIEIKKYPKLTEVGAWRDDGNGGKYGGYYTQEDIKEVVKYAESRGVTVVPEIELPGHSQAALASYPQLSCTGGPFEVETEWGVFKEIYCAGNEDTFKFLEDVLTEVMALFPSQYIHIGGDEAPKFRWENCDKCQQRIKVEGLKDEHELQSYFIKRIEKFVSAHGRQIIGWDEILEGGLAPGATVQSWRGYEGAIAAVKSGHNAIVSPTSHAYFDYSINDIDMEKVYSFNPVPDGLTAEEASLIIGGECEMWSERAPQHLVDSKVFPRILAMSEVLWSDTTQRSYSEFIQRVKQQYPILNKLGVTYGFEKKPVSTGSMVKNGQLYATLTSYDPKMELYYTINDNDSKKYNDEVLVTKPSAFKITFKKEGIFYADTLVQEFVPHLGIGSKPELISAYSDSYVAGGKNALIDGKMGSDNFKDGNWQGYWGKDVEVVLDLGKEATITTLNAAFFQHNNSWIFFPAKVEFLISNNGVDFKSMGIVENEVNAKANGQLIQDYKLVINPSETRYVKMKAYSIGKCPDWHDGTGNDSWLFADELIIN